ncbi:MAG: hypothetical protein IPK97_00195 [Ahniella sp.]|nr:hypothetical protein [Ahniella sp.]
MQLHLNPSAGLHLVRQVAPGRVVLTSGDWSQSFLLCPKQGPRAFPAATVADLAEAHFSEVLAEAPDILLLGTGTQLQFPGAELRARLMAARVGLEVMDNAACARTFNVLAGESRSVMAIFLLPVSP